MLESQVEQSLRKEIEKLGGKAYKLESQGNTGMPDRLVCLPGGKVFFIETKRPKGGRLSKRQVYVIGELQRLGFDVRVVNTYELISDFISEAKNGL